MIHLKKPVATFTVAGKIACHLWTAAQQSSEVFVVCFPLKFFFTHSALIKRTLMKDRLSAWNSHSYNEFSNTV